MLDFSMINTPSLWVDRHRHMVGQMAVTLSGPIDELSFRHNEYLIGAYAQVQLKVEVALDSQRANLLAFVLLGQRLM